MPEALVFGGSGQIGTPLVQRLLDAGWEVHAVSRDARQDRAGLHWLRGDLAACEGLPARVDAIFSCGPLDHFARWHATSHVEAANVVAFGSTSAAVKQASADPGEADLARRLAEGERVVLATAAARGSHATLLRPTLVYGSGRDRTLSRMARFADRWGVLPVPADARGLRQPVHVDDLAMAAIAACGAPAARGNTYDLPGGEALPFREMVARVLAVLPSRPKLLALPAPMFVAGMQVARLAGRGGAVGASALARLREDLVFDVAPAARDLGYAPRAFAPTADMFLRDEPPR